MSELCVWCGVCVVCVCVRECVLCVWSLSEGVWWCVCVCGTE